MASLLERFTHDPVGLVARGIRKLVVDPLRYRHGNGYDAERYWGDRFRRYGRSLRGPGHEGVSEAENARVYEQAKSIVLDACRHEGVDFIRARVLEIGCGTGFYTRMCSEQGVAAYTGVDVTAELFPTLQAEFPSYQFVRHNIAAERLSGNFDLILMIDVVEHIVTEEGLSIAIDNVRRCLADDGVFLLSLPRAGSGAEHLFYLRCWSLEAVLRRLDGFDVAAPLPFRYGSLLAARRPRPAES